MINKQIKEELRPTPRVFLEGVEVSCVGVQLKGEIGQAATAQVTLPWTPDADRLLPRTTVHISVDGYLAFVGEVVQVAESDSVEGQMAVLGCIDNTFYWKQAKVYFVTGWPNILSTSLVEIKSNFSGVRKKSNGASDFLMPRSYLMGSLMKPSRTYPGVKGIMAGAIRLLEDISGKHEDLQNPFFVAADARLRLFQQIGIAQKDTTAKSMLKTTSARSFIRRLVKQLGNQVDYQTVVDGVMGLIHYARMPVLFPALRPGFPYKVPYKVRAASGAKPRNTGDRIQHRIHLLKYLYKAMNGQISVVSTTDEATQNRLTTNRKTLLLALQEYKRQTTNPIMGVTEAHEGSLLHWISQNSGAVAVSHKQGVQYEKNLAAEIIKKDYIAKFRKALKTLDSISDASKVDASGAPASFLFELEAAMGGKAGTGVLKTTIRQALRAYGAKGGKGGKLVSKERTENMPRRLPTTLLFPNIGMFAPPPLCNLIFEDDYTSFNFSTDFISPPTRLLVTKEPEKRFLRNPLAIKSYHVLPNVLAANKDKYAERAKGDPALLLPHEVYTGIVPDFIFMEDLRLFKINSKKRKKTKPPLPDTARIPTNPVTDFVVDATAKAVRGLQAASDAAKAAVTVEASKPGGGASSSVRKPRNKGYNDEYIERYASYELFLRRFAPNQATVRGRFMPELVVGMSAAIFRGDKVVAGQVLNVVHSLTPDSVSTEVVLGSCRVVGRENLLGLEEELHITGGDARYGTVLISGEVVFKGGGASVKNTSLKKAPKGKTTINDLSKRDKQRTIDRLIKLATKQTSLAQRLAGTTIEFIDVAVKVYRGRTKAEIVDVDTKAFEDIVRPPWLDDTFSNSRIGDVYEDLFGSRSVCDRISIRGLNGKNIDVHEEWKAEEYKPKSVSSAADVKHNIDAMLSRLDGMAKSTGTLGESGPSVQSSLESIHRAYKVVKEHGGSTAEFSEGMRRRKGAKIERILGPVTHTVPDAKTTPEADEPIARPFHHFAVGDAEIENMPKGLDPRGARRRAVLAYRDSLINRPNSISQAGDATVA